MSLISKGMIVGLAFTALTNPGSAQERLRTECLPFNASTDVTGGQTIEIDCFQTPTVDMTWRATQLTLDCPLRGGAGSMGSIELVALTRDPDGDYLNGRAGGDPSIVGPLGLIAINLSMCQAAATPPLGIPHYSLTAGTRYHVVTATYRMGDCDTGEFTGFIRPGTYTDPPIPANQTRSRNGANVLVPLDVVDTTLTLLTGTCCEQGVCIEDGLREPCCSLNHPGAEFVTGKTCADPEPCTTSCCLPDGDCVEANTQACVSLGGTVRPAEPFCKTAGGCCLPDATCVEIEPGCCTQIGGIPGGLGSTCEPVESCCFTDDSCEDNVYPPCCAVLGGISTGTNGLCNTLACCCFATGGCVDGLNPTCCTLDGGVPQPDGLACQPFEACCFEEGDCALLEPFGCTLLGGLPDGIGTHCSNQHACCQIYGSVPRSSRGADSRFKLYWTDYQPRIMRVNLDGTQAQVYLTLDQIARGIAVHSATNDLYWGDGGGGGIRRFDGKEITTIVPGVEARHLAIHEYLGRIYWTTSGAVQFSNLDGSNVTTLATGQIGDGDIALDLVNERIYWASENTGSIQRANWDGTDVEFVIGAFRPGGIAVTASKIYWIERGYAANHPLWRADLDGANVETVYVFPTGIPGGMVVDGDDLFATASGIYRLNLRTLDVSFLANAYLAAFDVALETDRMADCQSNGVPDRCDLFLGTSSDCNQNDLPDECEAFPDADCDGVQDDGDVCPGQDDTIDLNGDRIPDCFQKIPTVSGWAMLALGFAFASAGKVLWRWRTIRS